MLFVSTPVSAQRLIDWPVRTGASAESLVAGPGAVFWNPAQIRPQASRGAALVVDVQAPDVTGFGMLAAAAAYAIDARTAIAVGYQHLGVDGIPITDDSPRAEGVPTLSVADDVFAAGAAHLLSEAVTVGGGAHYVRPAEGGSREAVFGLGAGLRYALTLPFTPVLAAHAALEDGNAVWGAAAAAGTILPAYPEVRLGGSYGVQHERGANGLLQRAALDAAWRDLARFELAVHGDPDVGGQNWSPAAAVELRLLRYEVGVVRESLPNDFGTVYSFRLGIGF